MHPRLDPGLFDLARREAHRLRDDAIERLWRRLQGAWRARRSARAGALPSRERPCHS